MSRITEFYRISAPAPGREMDDASRSKYYRRLRLQAFVSATLGYSLYYVCRTSLNVMKKPVLDSGSLDASQLGVIGSALLFAYAVGKFVNGFIADYCNIKRFMATGLIVSAAANALMGLLGLAHSVVPTTVIFVAFAVMWGLNGWAQSMGAPPAIISLSRWYPLNERGTYYGFFSASHNLGEFFSFLFVGSIVTFAGWQAGFFGSALAGATGVLVVLCWLHDTPESKGLPPVEALAHEKPVPGGEKSVREIQKQVLRTPAVWVLAAASAFMYISRSLCNQRMGRTVPAGGQRILGRRGNLHRLDKRPLGNSRNGAFGMVFGQAFQGRPQDSRTDIRRIELRGAGAVPLRR